MVLETGGLSLSQSLPIVIVGLVFGGVALAMGLRSWRGRSEAARCGALRNGPQFTTPGIGGFVLMPTCGIAFIAVSLGILVAAVLPVPAARVAMLVLGPVFLVSMVAGLVAAFVSEHRGSPVWAPRWFRETERER